MGRLALAATMVLSCASVLVAQTPTQPVATWQASGTNGAVVAGGEDAVAAGMEVLREGGNAIDAAVATILALTVTDSGSCCFGGEVPILVFDAQRGVVEALAGQGAAPRLATQTYFEQRGGIPGQGIESAAVPAVLDVCVTALDRSGTRTFAQVAAPTLRLLDKGNKDWHPQLARTIRRLNAAEAASPSDRKRGLRLVADAFYRGPIAHEIDRWSREHGGLIRYVDLATHVTRVEEPVAANYRGMSVVKCGAWTQGPYLLEALQILEGYDLKSMGHNQPDAIHTTVEALKLALADRDTYLADPLYADVPLAELLAPAYASKRRSLIDPLHASHEQRPGDPRHDKALLEQADARKGSAGPANDTTTCLVADRFGNVVAATPSGWSGVVVGTTGVWLGSRLQSFNAWAGHPNCIEPGKRPRITLTPTIVLRDGKPVAAISVAGGDNQDQMTLQLLLNRFDFGLEADEAVTAPRFMSDHFLGSFRQTRPKLGQLRINPQVGGATMADLAARGHDLVVSPTPLGAAATMITIDPATKRLHAAGDPRAKRHAGAY